MFAGLNFCQGKSERVFHPNEMWEAGLILLFLFIISNVLIILTSIISFSHIAVRISYNEIQDFICFCEYRFLSYLSLVSPMVSGWPSTSTSLLFYGGGEEGDTYWHSTSFNRRSQTGLSILLTQSTFSCSDRAFTESSGIRRGNSKQRKTILLRTWQSPGKSRAHDSHTQLRPVIWSFCNI